MDNNQQSQKPQTKVEQQPKNQPAEQPKKSSSLVLIIIILVAVIFLGVGGYFGFKYYVKAKLKKATSLTASTPTTTGSTTSATGQKLSLKTLQEIFKYPNSTITSEDYSKSSGEVANITSEAPDKVNTVYDYYVNLAAQKNLTVTKKSLESDNYHGELTIQGKDYYVDIYLYQYENTRIEILFFGDNITNDTAPSANSTTSSTTSKTTPSTTSSQPATAASGSYIIADSSTRVITESELTKLTPWQLKVARNEIYARHGREFVHRDLQCYFDKQSWYQGDPNFSETMLSTTENKNVATILAYETKTSSPLLQTDSGCNTNQ